MTLKEDNRFQREINHSRKIAEGVPADIWGWGTQAGKIRAERRGKLIAAAARLQPGKVALEIGCGTGIFTEIFAHSRARIIAVDISGELIETARQRKLPEKEIIFLEKPFEECDVEGPFDAVIGSSILHHLELEVAMKKVLALLKPGGRLSFAEPNYLNPQIFVERRFRRFFANVSPDETAFVRWSLKSLLEKIGFTNVRITPFDWLHPCTPESLIGMVSALGGWVEKVPVFREFSGSLLIEAARPE